MTVKTDLKTYYNLIDGSWIPSSDEKVKEITNPADAVQVVGRVPSSTIENVNQAVQAAKKALVTWREISPMKRGEFLRKAADILESRADDIARTLTLEMGKTLKDAKGETLRAVDVLRYFAAEGTRELGSVIPSSQQGVMLYTKRVPIGVVGLITPWNFPIAIPAWKTAPALVYGNTVVLKAASETSITAIKFVECLKDAGIPAGVINIVNGSGSVIGNALCDHPDVNAISFTGSNEVGNIISEKTNKRGAKCQLEMGGKNPVIVTENADLDLAAELTVNGSMNSTGQKCTATSRAIVVSSVYDEFKYKVLEKVNAITVGNGLEDNFMGPIVSEKQLNHVLTMIEKGKEEGASLIAGGKRINDAKHENGYFIEPTVFEKVNNQMTIAQEEIFGPVLALIKTDSLEEAVAIANDVKYGLSSSLFTKDLKEAFHFVDKIEAGMVRVNGESTGVEYQAPFGGMKASSSHSREQGKAAMEFFTSIKTITINP
ncbi:aldehyde dehydrogenase family protein [Oceanobacillus arenosus]|uniref:Aldehyde dehydrogenase family protein n=1 Tax=Oceanobacillus arenosus TaxID=1229153 RepID=A0A3D8PN47_9BACI|nr:alpha-ketoglutaric semialdehyde dehydrogenase GucD [Oceanobacillus arenosus]RDW17520.1 aldehyde dehydrogenase family protein [Oceanobacillus arenosus]